MICKYIFLDLETTGLCDYDQITEAAWVCDDNTTRQMFVSHTRTPSDYVLNHTDYLTRIKPAPKISARQFLRELRHDCDRLGGADVVYMVGACPSFDDRFIRTLCSTPPYNYHILDIEAIVLGAVGGHPRHLSELREALSMPARESPAHQALPDALEVREIWLAWDLFPQHLGEHSTRATRLQKKP